MNKSELIKTLRASTLAGMADCIKALEETNNDLEAAQKWLREHGIAKANKKAGAIAYEGAVKAGAIKNKAIVIEINSQTDFTAQNENFLKLVNKVYENVTQEISKTQVIDVEQYLKANAKIKDEMISLSAVTGEKIALRRGNVIVAKSDNTIGTYTHSNNKIATIIIFKGKVSEEVAKNVAMHAAAMAPKYLNEHGVSQEWLKSEREILVSQFHEELKAIADPKAKAEKEKRADLIVDGKVKKLLKEVCLVDQPYVKDNSKTVAQYVKDNGSELLNMIRYELGEGIEKKESNFADEVAAQMHGNK